MKVLANKEYFSMRDDLARLRKEVKEKDKEVKELRSNNRKKNLQIKQLKGE